MNQLVDLADSLHGQRQSFHHAFKRHGGRRRRRRLPRRRQQFFSDVTGLQSHRWRRHRRCACAEVVVDEAAVTVVGAEIQQKGQVHLEVILDLSKMLV
jgi:hypothetical protein